MNNINFAEFTPGPGWMSNKWAVRSHNKHMVYLLWLELCGTGNHPFPNFIKKPINNNNDEFQYPVHRVAVDKYIQSHHMAWSNDDEE